MNEENVAEIKETESNPLTKGAIYKPLMKFMLPVLLALFLQAMYSAVDLIVVGYFTPSDIVQAATSAVGTGSMVMVLVTYVITGLTMGATVVLGRKIGAKDKEGASRTVGASICVFIVLALVIMALLVTFASSFAELMNAPSIEYTTQYIRICGIGTFFIVAYNAISGIFRGIGDSKHPLMFVAIACVANIILDIVTVKVFNLGVAGVAISTTAAQAISVILSALIIRKIDLPFTLSRKNIRFYKEESIEILKAGIPLSLQDFLTNMSFIVINTVANQLGSDPTLWTAIASGYSIDSKITVFTMILPCAFLQSMAVFTAQNVGAKEYKRAKKGLKYMMATAVVVGIVLACLSEFGGSLLARIFTSDAEAIYYASEYLKGYALDCLFATVALTLLGYFNGLGYSTFVLIQGLIGSFFVRIPLILWISNWENATLTHLGIASSSATMVTFILCAIFYFVKGRKLNVNEAKDKVGALVDDTSTDNKLKNHIIITISREYGSGGRYVGRIIADKLGIKFYDKELIEKVAENTGLSEEYIENNEQTRKGQANLNGYALGGADELFVAETNAIKELAEKGSCVIVGRCADYVLRDNENVVKIFIYSDMENKIKRTTEIYGIDKEKAKNEINKINKERANHYKYYTKRKWGDLDNYDFCINCDSLGVEKTADILCEMIKEKDLAQI